MDVCTFIGNYREAFGQQAELPVAFWYSDRLEAPTGKVNGCFFKSMAQVRNGEVISLSAETMGCGGGKFYTGFADMPEHVPAFVSLKEKYKKTPEAVIDFIQKTQVSKVEKTYLHFARIDKIASFDKVEGVLFLATPDMLAGLAAWAFFRQQRTRHCIGSVRFRLLFRRNTGRSRKPEARIQDFPGIFRPVRPTLF